MCINLKVYLIVACLKVKKNFLLNLITQDIPYLLLEPIGLLESTVTHLDGSAVLLRLLLFCYF